MGDLALGPYPKCRRMNPIVGPNSMPGLKFAPIARPIECSWMLRGQEFGQEPIGIVEDQEAARLQFSHCKTKAVATRFTINERKVQRFIRLGLALKNISRSIALSGAVWVRHARAGVSQDVVDVARKRRPQVLEEVGVVLDTVKIRDTLSDPSGATPRTPFDATIGGFQMSREIRHRSLRQPGRVGVRALEGHVSQARDDIARGPMPE